MDKKTGIRISSFNHLFRIPVYIVRYYFSEEAKETMQEKINRMLVTEASRQEM